MAGANETVSFIPNGLVLVGDELAELPVFDPAAAVSVSPGRIAVVTRHEQNGDTRLRLIAGAPIDSILPATLVFDGQVRLPARRLVVETVLLETLLTCEIKGVAARVQIWIDDLPEPSDIAIVIAEPREVSV